MDMHPTTTQSGKINENNSTTPSSIQLHSSSQTKNVLVADDEPGVCAIIKKILERNGYSVTTAANGQEALSYLENNPETHIQLLITDLNMPIIGGKELAQKIKAINPYVKVLYISGYMNI